MLDYKPTVTSDPTYVSQNNSLWQLWGFYLFIYLFVNWLNYRINFAVLCFVMNGLFCTIIVLSATVYYSSHCSLLEVINKIFRYYRARYPQIGCHQPVVLMDTPMSSSYKDTLSKYIYSCFLQFQKWCKELFVLSVVIPFHAWNHAVVTNLPDFTNLFFFFFLFCFSWLCTHNWAGKALQCSTHYCLYGNIMLQRQTALQYKKYEAWYIIGLSVCFIQ